MNIKFSNLNNVKFKTFREAIAAIRNGEIVFGSDQSFAFQWARGGRYLPDELKRRVGLLSAIPLLAAASFVLYILGSGKWISLLGLFVVPFSYILFHSQGAKNFFGMRRMLELAAIVGMIYGCMSGLYALTATSALFIVSGLAIRQVYRISTFGLIDQLELHEDLFCDMWPTNAITIHEKNGSVYSNAVTIDTAGNFQDSSPLESRPKKRDPTQSTHLLVNGSFYKINNHDLDWVLHPLVRYGLFEMKLSDEKAFEFGVMTLASLRGEEMEKRLEAENLLTKSQVAKKDGLFGAMELSKTVNVIRREIERTEQLAS